VLNQHDQGEGWQVQGSRNRVGNEEEMAINNENELPAACNSRIAMVLTKQSSLLGLTVFENLRYIYIYI